MSNDNIDSPDIDATRTTMADTGMLCAGDLLAERYRIILAVGVGAMGAVYSALDERLDVRVALKVLHAGVASDRNAMRRFESELRLARQVTHPNVVRIHDIGEHQNLSFLTMDLVEGAVLSDLITEHVRLPAERAARIGAGIASGLAAAHKQGVVHRDLKPGNILVGADDHAYITDFGVAKSIAAARVTRTGMFVGTPDYLAPEQARGEDVDGRCDIYALGLILFEMLSGRLPTNAGSMQELIAQRTVGRLPDLSRLPDDTPPHLRAIITRCLHKDPADRYQDAGELARDLADGKVSRPPSPWRRRRAVAVAVGVAAVAALVTFFVVREKAPEPLPTAGAPPVAADASAGPANADSAPAVAGLTFAILPFSDEANDPAMAWLSTGLIEALTAELDASSGLDVVSEQRVRTTLDDLRIPPGPQAPEDARQLASLFGADWLVSGTLLAEDGKIAVDAIMHTADTRGADRIVPRVAVDLAQAGTLGSALAGAIRDMLSLPVPSRQPMRLSSDLNALRHYASGVDHLALGDSVSAIAPLEQAVATDPEFAAAWLKLAEAYDVLGRTQDAAASIERAIASGGGDTRVGEMAQIRHLAFGGNIEKARELLQKIVRDEPGDGDARLMLAELTGDEGHFAQAITLLKELVADDPNHPRAWYLLGKFSIQNGDSQQALGEYLINALAIQERLNNDQGRADVFNAMGVAQHRIGQLEEAKRSYTVAAATREKIGDQRGLASSLGNIASIELQLGRLEEARRTYDRAIAVRSALGDAAGLADLYNIYGTIEEERGDYRAALRRYRQALQIREDTGDLRALANSYTNIGYAYFVLGEYDNAGVYWQRAVAQAIATDNPDSQMLAEQSLGQLRLAEGDWAGALELLLGTLDASRSTSYAAAEAVALGNLGRVAQRQGRYGAALSSYADALKIVEKLGDARGLIEYSLWRADTYLELANTAAANAELDGANLLLEQAGNDEQRATLNVLRGTLALKKGDSAAADQAFELAIRHAGRTGSDVPVLSAMVARAEAGAPIAKSDLQELARNVLDLGNADLTLRMMSLQLRAAQSAEAFDLAGQFARELLFKLAEHTPYGRAWQFHAQAADAFDAVGDAPAAQAQRAAAAAEVRRLLTDLPASSQKSFMLHVEQAGIQLQ